MPIRICYLGKLETQYMQMLDTAIKQAFQYLKYNYYYLTEDEIEDCATLFFLSLKIGFS